MPLARPPRSLPAAVHRLGTRAACLPFLLAAASPTACVLDIGEATCSDGLTSTLTRRGYSISAARPSGCQLEHGQSSHSAATMLVEELKPVLGARHGEEFRVVSVDIDELGAVHVRFRQEIHGIRVEGGEIIVHIDDSGREIAALNGTYVSGQGLPDSPRIDAQRALTAAVLSEVPDARVQSQPELRYVRNGDNLYQLAWKALIAYEDHRGPHVDEVFADAMTGELVTRHPLIHDALYRKIYTANNKRKPADELLFEEGGTHSDPVAMSVYESLGATYEFWLERFGRDSYDGTGSPLVATVHYGSDYANAYWDSAEKQLVFGDGNEEQRVTELDIVAHEYTHAVVGSTAELIYVSESGALNESLADIGAMAVQSRTEGGVSQATWTIGEVGTTPEIDGDAMRYAGTPRRDCQSSDFFPTRYTGRWDGGGVHLNSGISNLAFYLLSEGGSHPRAATDVVVPGIGMEAAIEIFVRALTTYLVSSSTFHDARAATVQAATDLYGDGSAVDAVRAAWDAVGVTERGEQPRALQNGETAVPLFGKSGSWTYFQVDIPAGTNRLVAELASTVSAEEDGFGHMPSSGPVHATLYLAGTDMPTLDNYECKSKRNCVVTDPGEGRWFVGLFGSEQQDYENLKVTVRFDESSSEAVALQPGVSLVDQSGSRDSWRFYYLEVPVGSTALDVTIDDGCAGAGNADLFVEYAAEPSGSFSDAGFFGPSLNTSSLCGDHFSPKSGKGCRITNPRPGRWFVGLLADSAYEGVAVTASIEGVPDSEVAALQSDVAETLEGERGDWRIYQLLVPEGAGQLVAELTAGVGDADLYLRHGSKPEASEYDCRSIRAGANERCDIASPEPGVWYIAVRGYTSYEAVALTASTDLVALRNSERYPVVADESGWHTYVIEIPEESDKLVVELREADAASLFVQHESIPTEEDSECKKTSGALKKCVVRNPEPGRWFVSLRIEGDVSEATLQARTARAYLLHE